MFFYLLVAGKLIETLVDTLDVIFSNETHNLVLLIFFHFLNFLVEIVPDLVEFGLQNILLLLELAELCQLVMVKFVPFVLGCAELVI